MLGGVFNIDLLWVGIVVAGAGTLGFTIFFAKQKSTSARSFLLFCILSICWSIANFVSARLTDPAQILWSIRLVLFFASWHAFSFYILAVQFPKTELAMSRIFFRMLIAWTAFISLWVLTPFVYNSVTVVSSATIVTKTGPGITLFGLTVFMYIILGIGSLIKKYIRSIGPARHQIEFILTGMTITFVLLVTFDFILPAFFENTSLISYGGLFLLPFIFATAYAILRYRLFNSRIAIFGLLIFLLATAAFFDILTSTSTQLIFYRMLELVVILVAGVWLLRSIETEYELQEELAETNRKQETLIHFIGHEVKGFLTKAEGAFSELSEGDFGALSETAKPFVSQALEETRNGVTSVSDILKASNQKKGTVTYHKADFDFRQLVEETAEKERPMAKRKGLELSVTADGNDFSYFGDRTELGDHVLRNLLENAIYYTPHGSIAVSLSESSGEISLSITDTGIGITEEDMRHLFTEGGHGKDSQRINANSTGYGLYIAQNTVAAHGGTIEAKSDGQGKGTTFTVRLPRMQSV